MEFTRFCSAVLSSVTVVQGVSIAARYADASSTLSYGKGVSVCLSHKAPTVLCQNDAS